MQRYNVSFLIYKNYISLRTEVGFGKGIAMNSTRRQRPSQAEAEAAVRTLIEWAGDDPDREGLVDTPNRVVRAYEEFFAGYFEDPVAMLTTTFEETAD